MRISVREVKELMRGENVPADEIVCGFHEEENEQLVKKKVEFSKFIFLGVTGMVFAVLFFSFVMMWRTGDLSPLMYIIPAVFVEFATATGFYYNKAKAENMLKMGEKDE